MNTYAAGKAFVRTRSTAGPKVSRSRQPSGPARLHVSETTRRPAGSYERDHGCVRAPLRGRTCVGTEGVCQGQDIPRPRQRVLSAEVRTLRHAVGPGYRSGYGAEAGSRHQRDRGGDPTLKGVLYGESPRLLVSGRVPPLSLDFRTSDGFGAPGGIRTHDPCLRRAVLYPAELRAHMVWPLRQ
jgi:hypothetical protein